MKYFFSFLFVILRVIDANPVLGDLGDLSDSASSLAPDESILTADDPETEYVIALFYPILHTTALTAVQPRKYGLYFGWSER